MTRFHQSLDTFKVVSSVTPGLAGLERNIGDVGPRPTQRVLEEANTLRATSPTLFNIYRYTVFDTLDIILCWARPLDKKLEDRVRKTNSSLSFALIPFFDLAHRVLPIGWVMRKL